MGKQGKSVNYDEVQPELLVNELVNSSVTETHVNIKQQVIVTTQDKLHLCLNHHLQKAKRSRDWVAPLGLVIAITIAFATATFQDFVLDAATWTALFVAADAIAVVWLVIAVVNASRYSVEPEDIIEEIKSGARR